MGDNSGKPELHAEVRDALTRARAVGRTETVIIYLHSSGSGSTLTAADTEKIARSLLDRVAAECGRAPEQKTVFENLGAMAVQADPDFLSKLVEQPEVRQVFLNEPQSAPVEPIRPVRKSPPGKKGWAK